MSKYFLCPHFNVNDHIFAFVFQIGKESKNASQAGKQLEVMWASLRYEAVHAWQHQGNYYSLNGCQMSNYYDDDGGIYGHIGLSTI